MSKKIATGATAIALDVKVGEGSFMPDLTSARSLAATMKAVGERLDMHVSALLTDMDRPLGPSVGNSLEVKTALSLLRGEERGPLLDVVLALGSLLLTAGGSERDRGSAQARLCRALGTGAALEKFRVWVEAQGGEGGVVEGAGLPEAPVVLEVPAGRGGWLVGVRARVVAGVCLKLGAGRETKDAKIDPAVGVVLPHQPGNWIEKGSPLAAVHARTRAQADEAAAMLRTAFALQDMEPAPRTIILGEL
jgi:thymidine phosphorylase